jgi:hypothetical protein
MSPRIINNAAFCFVNLTPPIQPALRFSSQVLAGDIHERFGWIVSILIVRSQMLNAQESHVSA